MGKSSPIPVRDRQKFVAHMDAVASTDEWVLLDAAEEFMIRARYLRGDPLSALEQWRRIKSEIPAPK